MDIYGIPLRRIHDRRPQENEADRYVAFQQRSRAYRHQPQTEATCARCHQLRGSYGGLQHPYIPGESA